MPPDVPYSPPLTPALLNRVAAIAEALGRWMGPRQSGWQRPIWYATTIAGPIDRSS
jgi:hypothetical protein